MTDNELTEEELIGEPKENVPEREPGENCNARKTTDGIFEGYCGQNAGHRTEHQGEGRCWLHGGNSPRGEDSPSFKHGLFSDYLSEDDREELEAIEERGNLANLQATINYEFLRLRRAVRNLEGEDEEDDQSFWDAYNEIIQSASETGLGNEEIASLAELLDASYGAFAKRIESLRKLVKTYEELSEGRKVNIDGDLSHTHSGEEGGAPISVEWKASEAERTEDESDDG
jgi:hypothetical protein